MSIYSPFGLSHFGGFGFLGDDVAITIDEQIDGVVYAGLGLEDDIPSGTFTSNNNTL